MQLVVQSHGAIDEGELEQLAEHDQHVAFSFAVAGEVAKDPAMPEGRVAARTRKPPSSRNWKVAHTQRHRNRHHTFACAGWKAGRQRQQGPQMDAKKQKTINCMAITGIMLGILGVFSLGFLFGVAAIALGAVALCVSKDNNGESAYCLACASIPLGVVSLGLHVLEIYLIVYTDYMPFFRRSGRSGRRG